MEDTALDEKPLSFAEMTKLQAQFAEHPYFGGMKLPEFAKALNDLTGSRMFDQGLSDNFVKRGSLRIDELLRPASEATGKFAGKVAQGVGLGRFQPELEQLGQSLPRSIAETVPVIAGSALMLAPEPSISKVLGGALLMGAGAASAGSKGYTETGSPLAGLITGGAVAALPATASLGQKVIAKPLINKFLTSPVATDVGTKAVLRAEKYAGSELAKLAESGLESFGANTAITIASELAGQAASVAAGQGLYNPLTVEHAVELAAGTLPFAAIDAALHVKNRLAGGFASRTGQENALVLGQGLQTAEESVIGRSKLMNEATQLAETATMIDNWRKTDLLSTPKKALPAPGESTTFPDFTMPEFVERKPSVPPMNETEAIRRALQKKWENSVDKEAKVKAAREQLTIEQNVQKWRDENKRLYEDGILGDVETLQREQNLAAEALRQASELSTQMEPTGAETAKAPSVKTDLRQLQKQMQKNTVSTEETLPTAFNAQLSSRDFFTKRFAEMGLPAESVARYTGIAEKIAAAYSDVGQTKVAELVGAAAGTGVHVPTSDLSNAFIAVAKSAPYNTTSLKVFESLQVASHELWHGVQRAAEKGLLGPVEAYRYNELAKRSAALLPEERTALWRHVWNTMVPDEYGRDKTLKYMEDFGGKNAGKDHLEFMADMASLYTLGLASPDTKSRVTFIRDELRFSSALEQQFAQAFYIPMRDIVQATKDFLKESGQSKEFLSALTDVHQGIESVLKDQKFIDKAVAQLQAIQRNDPAYFEQLRGQAQTEPVSWNSLFKDPLGDVSTRLGLDKAVKAARSALGFKTRVDKQKELGVHPLWFEKVLYPVAQLAAEYPQLQGIYNIVRSHSAIANDYLMQIMAPFLSKPSKLGHITIDAEAHGLKRVASSKVEVDALKELTLIGNYVSKNEKRLLSNTEIQETLPKTLSAEAKTRVADLYNTLVKDVYPKLADMQVAAAMSSVSHAVTAIIQQRNKGMKWKDALKLGTYARDAVLNQADPLKAMEVQQTLALLNEKAGPEATKSAITTATEMLGSVKKLQKLFDSNPGYSPETTLGRYLVLWKRGKEWGRFGSDDFAEAKKKLDAIRNDAGIEKRKDGSPNAFMQDKNDSRGKTAGMDPDLVERWNDIRSSGERAAARELGVGSDEYNEVMRVISHGEDAIVSEVKSKGMQQFLLPRRLAEGREDINPVMNFLNYVSGVSHGLAKKYTREQAGLAFQDAELRNNPKLQEIGREHLENVTNPSARELSALKKLNFAYFMGFSPAQMLLEGSQGVMTFVPQITRDTGSISASYKVWGKAVSQVVSGFVKGKKLDDPVVQAYLDRAVKEGRVDAGVMQEFNTLEENLIPNLRALAGGDSTFSKLGDLVKKPAYWYLHAARWLYSWAPRANSHVAFVAAFDVAQTHLKLKGEAAYEYAINTVDRTMFGGGKAGRPVGAFADAGKFQGVLGLMYSLQTYTFSTISMMGRLAKDSIASSDRLTPAEKTAARKAFGQMMVTQVALGGALSLPMTSGILAVIDQLFPEAEVKRRTKEAVEDTLGGADGLSGMLADVALKGLPNAMGVDLSSRVGLSSMLGVNPYSGFQLGNLVGPFGSVVENVVKGVRSATQGDMQAATKSLLPVPFKNVMDLTANQGQIRDAAGKLLYEPSAGEQALIALGFKPKVVADRQEAAQMIRQGEDVERSRLARFHQEQSTLLQSGRPGEVRQNLLQFAAANQGYDPRRGAMAVVELAQKATTPVELERTGARTTAAQRQRVLQGVQLPTPPSEVQQLLQRKALERTLQIPGAGAVSNHEMSLAQAVDYIKATNPQMPTQQAKDLAMRMMGRVSQGL